MANSYAPFNLYWPCSDEPADFDWSDAWDDSEQDTRYEFWETVPDDDQLIYSSGSGSALRFTKAGTLAAAQEHENGYEGEAPEGPLMNGYWPLTSGNLPNDWEPEQVAMRIRHLSVCLVLVDDQYGLALTGGGMDLRWNLAAAAIGAGFLPWSALRLHDWSYGVSTVGLPWARRVRAAVRYRLQRNIRRERADLREIAERWR